MTAAKIPPRRHKMQDPPPAEFEPMEAGASIAAAPLKIALHPSSRSAHNLARAKSSIGWHCSRMGHGHEDEGYSGPA